MNGHGTPNIQILRFFDVHLLICIPFQWYLRRGKSQESDSLELFWSQRKFIHLYLWIPPPLRNVFILPILLGGLLYLALKERLWSYKPKCLHSIVYSKHENQIPAVPFLAISIYQELSNTFTLWDRHRDCTIETCSDMTR